MSRVATWLEPIVLMMVGRIQAYEVRESHSDPHQNRTKVAHLRQELWALTQDSSEEVASAKITLRSFEGNLYALLQVPLVQEFNTSQFGTMLIAVECTDKALVSENLESLKQLVEGALGLWDNSDSSDEYESKADTDQEVFTPRIKRSKQPAALVGKQQLSTSELTEEAETKKSILNWFPWGKKNPKKNEKANQSSQAGKSQATNQDAAGTEPSQPKSSRSTPSPEKQKPTSRPAVRPKRANPTEAKSSQVGSPPALSNHNTRASDSKQSPPEKSTTAESVVAAGGPSKTNTSANAAENTVQVQQPDKGIDGSTVNKKLETNGTEKANASKKSQKTDSSPKADTSRKTSDPSPDVAVRKVSPKASSKRNETTTSTPSAMQRQTGHSPVEANQDAEKSTKKQSAAAQDAIARASQFESHVELAYELANSVSNRFECEQVGVGLVAGGRVRLIALSGVAIVKSNSPGAMQIRQAMEECADQNQLVAFPNLDHGEEDYANGVHRMWSRGTGECNVYSFPMQDHGGECTAVLSLRRTAEHPLNSESAKELQETVGPFGPGMILLRRSSRSLLSHITDSLLEKKNRLTSSITRLFVFFAALSFLLWCWLGTMHYKPSCNSKVTSGSIRHVTAPINGRLKEVFVREGEKFATGDPLIQFATEKLELQKHLLEAEFGEAAVEFKQALADKEPKAIALKRAKLEVIQAKIQGAQEQLSQALILADREGSVSHHDLRKSIGQEFQFGDAMMELALGEIWDLEIEVPDRIASFITPGHQGTFSPVGRPMDLISFRVESVSGLAEVRDGKNVFVARARLENPREWMRGGMEGTAKITTEKQRVYWVLFRDVIDWAHETIWF
ncbi:MAG: efflux RND transporter periplasmic adaptor subunit [Planctomycetota bacterium]